jgi:nicotinate-nucleotide adenylyltransferase
MRIGVLGGSFDPPHVGHLEMARAAQSALNLDVIFFIPAFSQWQKTHVASPQLRAHMVGLAIAGHSQWQVNLLELDRRSTTFTVETMSELNDSYPTDELVFIVGADAAAGLDSWQDSQRLAGLCEFAVVTRPDYEVSVPAGFRYTAVQAETSDISSSDIRSWIHQGDADSLDRARAALHPAVFEFITTTGLYK